MTIYEELKYDNSTPHTGGTMNLLKNSSKLFLGLIGISVNVAAQTQPDPNLVADLSPLEVTQLNNNHTQSFQVVSQEELINALQNNKLEQLLLNKGILIQKPSADSTVCKLTGSGGD